MFVVPVEKKGKYSHDLSLRFLCFDPATRMAYLSDKGSKVREWKHRMKVYAVMPKCVQGGQDLQYRLWNFEAKELLSFTIAGVAYSRLDSSDAATRAELRRLPTLLNESYQDGRPIMGTYTSGDAMPSASEQPVSATDDAKFFAKGREDWILRGPYYNATHDVIMLMRDVLIADGLRFPLYGGLAHGVDPRNGLQLASFPLYLQLSFHHLLGAIVYTCVHGRMIGCDPHGNVGTCMRHVYLCITDKDVLFVAENGAVARTLPLSFLDRVEYSGPALSSGGDANAHGSPTRSPTSPPPSTPARGGSPLPYAAFLTIGDPADVLFSPCSAFPAESDDCSASMAAAMPRMSVGKELGNAVHVLQTLLNAQARGGRGTDARQQAGAGEEDVDADIHLADTPTSAGLSPAPVASVPPLKPDGFALVTLPTQETLQDYADAFEARHGRTFKWVPVPSGQHLTPTVQAAAAVARSLGLHPAPRQAIARREEFLPYYYGSQAAAAAAVEAAEAAQEARALQVRELAHGDEGYAGEDLYADGMYAPTVPVRRVSKIIDMFKPDTNIY